MICVNHIQVESLNTSPDDTYNWIIDNISPVPDETMTIITITISAITRTIQDPGTKLDLLINNWLTSAYLSRGLRPSILSFMSYGERIRRRTQAQAVHIQNSRKVRCPLQALHAHLATQHV